MGAFNSPSGNGIQYFTKEGSLIEGLALTSESILYARWELKTYNINFKVGNDIFKVITKTYGDSFELVEFPEKQGYTFVGWADKNGNLFTNSLGYFEYGKQTFSKESGYDFNNNSDSVILYDGQGGNGGAGGNGSTLDQFGQIAALGKPGGNGGTGGNGDAGGYGGPGNWNNIWDKNIMYGSNGAGGKGGDGNPKGENG